MKVCGGDAEDSSFLVPSGGRPERGLGHIPAKGHPFAGCCSVASCRHHDLLPDLAGFNYQGRQGGLCRRLHGASRSQGLTFSRHGRPDDDTHLDAYDNDTPEVNESGDLEVVLGNREVLLPTSIIRANSEDE